MKKDMFYNYEHNINKKEYPEIFVPKCQRKVLEGFSGMQLIYNIKGDILGISTKKNNPIDLYFSLDGAIDGICVAETKINGVRFEILNVLHEPVISKTSNVDITDNMLHINISAEENTLLQDIYKIKLLINIDDSWYTLFGETDGLLEIV